MKVFTAILIAVSSLSLATPATTMGQAWETDGYGFLIDTVPATARTRRTQRRRSYRVQPKRVFVNQPVYRAMPTQPPLNVVASADSGTTYRSFSYEPSSIETAVQPMINASGVAAVTTSRTTVCSVRSRRMPTYLRPGAKARGDFGHGG